jgi:hypothetical protein
MQTRIRISCPEYGLPEAIVPATWDSVMTWKPDDLFKNYLLEPKGEITIQCSDLPTTWDVDEVGRPWTTILIMDNSCYEFFISIDLYNDSWTEFWVGTFNSTLWEINRDKKYLKVKTEPYEYAINCIKENWNTIINLWDMPERVAVKPNYTSYDIFEFLDTYTEPCDQQDIPSGVDEYCFSDVTQIYSGFQNYQCLFFWHRLVRPGTCEDGDPIPPDLVPEHSWYFLSGTCPAPLFWRCPDSERLTATYDNGVFFNDFVEYLFAQTGCGLQVRSIFFGIVETTGGPDNSAYQAAALYLREMVVFQKSDIKRFDSSNNSDKPSWVAKLSDLLNDLWIMFKVKPRDEDGILRLEHISYYESLEGNDYTSENYQNILKRDNSEAKRLTRFYFKDEQCSDYFKGSPIEIFCGDGEDEKRLSLFATDLIFTTDSDNAESITDAGWFLMATQLEGGERRVIDENRPLSWTELHANFHTYEMAGVGKINNEDVVPESLAKTRKQPPFKVRKRICDDFSPETYQITSLGQGDVDSADWSIEKNTLELNLKY